MIFRFKNFYQTIWIQCCAGLIIVALTGCDTPIALYDGNKYVQPPDGGGGGGGPEVPISDCIDQPANIPNLKPTAFQVDRIIGDPTARYVYPYTYDQIVPMADTTMFMVQHLALGVDELYFSDGEDFIRVANLCDKTTKIFAGAYTFSWVGNVLTDTSTNQNPVVNQRLVSISVSDMQVHGDYLYFLHRYVSGLFRYRTDSTNLTLNEVWVAGNRESLVNNPESNDPETGITFTGDNLSARTKLGTGVALAMNDQYIFLIDEQSSFGTEFVRRITHPNENYTVSAHNVTQYSSVNGVHLFPYLGSKILLDDNGQVYFGSSSGTLYKISNATSNSLYNVAVLVAGSNSLSAIDGPPSVNNFYSVGSITKLGNYIYIVDKESDQIVRIRALDNSGNLSTMYFNGYGTILNDIHSIKADPLRGVIYMSVLYDSTIYQLTPIYEP